MSLNLEINEAKPDAKKEAKPNTRKQAKHGAKKEDKPDTRKESKPSAKREVKPGVELGGKKKVKPSAILKCWFMLTLASSNCGKLKGKKTKIQC